MQQLNKHYIANILLAVTTSIMLASQTAIASPALTALAEQYCGTCHYSEGTITEFLHQRGAATAQQQYQFLLKMVESEFMPPAPWHRQQLQQLLKNKEYHWVENHEQ